MCIRDRALVTSRLLKGDQIEPISLFLLDHARGFDHAPLAYLKYSHFKRAPSSPLLPLVLLGSAGSACPAVLLPPITMDLGLLLISIGVVNLWRARENAG